MLNLIEQRQPQIATICSNRGVKRLELFGSAAGDDFDPQSSDIDFFVEFISYDAPTIADQWFGLQEDLQRLLGRRVDLTSPRMATNPYFLQSANRSKVTLYAA
jgi:hypothetical protein